MKTVFYFIELVGDELHVSFEFHFFLAAGFGEGTLNLLQQGFLIGTTQTVDSMQERLVKIKFVGFQKLNSAWLESKLFCLHIYI